MVVPKLRFKADDGSDFPELEAKSLFDICEYKNKQSVGKNYVGTENMKQNFSGLESLDEETEMKGVCYCEGDTLMSNIRPYLRKTWKADREGVCSTDVLVFHPIDVVSEYLHYLIASDKFISYVMTGAKGVKMPRGDKEHMMKFSIMVPSLPEQQKIADFLSTIDTIIEKQQATVSAWEERKKGVMQKLFSQEVRFKADDGSDFPDWEEKKIASLGDMVGGGTPTTKKKEYWHGKTAWISSADVEENDIYNINMTRFITQEAIDNSATKIIPKNSILIVSRVGVGKVAKAPCDLCTSQDFTNIVDVKGDSTFLTYAVLRLMQSKLQCVQGTSIKGIPSDEIRNYIMNVPSLPEQQKIADCLSALDTVIQKQKETLERWQELKKGLLQQMFV